MRDLNAKAWLGLVSLALCMGSLLFVAAGTLRYWQAWVYLIVYVIASLLITLYLMRRNPILLMRRMSGGPTAEKEKIQKMIMLVASMGFVSSLILPALCHRLGWSNVPFYAVVIGDVLTASFFYIAFLSLKENTFASATIEVAEGQKVITTGPYGLVRHPMYSGGILLFVGTPLALGSFFGLVGFAVALPALVWRLLDEEKLLAKRLPGYAEYCVRVRWRLIPGLF